MFLLGIVLLNVVVQFSRVRFDLTEDKRFSLSETTLQLLNSTDKEFDIVLYLDGEMNSGFRRLKDATTDILREMGQYATIRYSTLNPVEDLTDQQRKRLWQTLVEQGLSPRPVSEHDYRGRTIQTMVYPFAEVHQGSKKQIVNLFQYNRGYDESENLNHSIETLEYAFAECFCQLIDSVFPKVAFLEGHQELPEQYTWDLQQAVAKYANIYRGSITNDATCLDDFDAVVIADPQQPFSERDKYVLDQYLMNGGSLLWAVSGVKLSEESLTDRGFTPIIPLDLNITDLLFRYGIRINPCLVADRQCLYIPVDVSPDPQQPSYQPMSWFYSPLLLPSEDHPISRDLMPVSATFCSVIDTVGDMGDIKKSVLLTTSNASRLVPAPSDVNLMDLNMDTRLFTRSFVPVAIVLEGQFSSLFSHRIKPDSVVETRPVKKMSESVKQVVIASGLMAQNDVRNGQPMPLGYDSYTKTQFGNRDFLLNAILYLIDNRGLVDLRQKTIPIRMLNMKRIEQSRSKIQALSTIVPLLVLLIVAFVIVGTRKYKYTSYKIINQ